VAERRGEVTAVTEGPKPSSKLPPYSPLHEPLLAFTSSTGAEGTDSHPLRGLLRHGPYSRTVLGRYTPTVRIATVGPVSSQRQVAGLISSLKEPHRATDRTDYVPDWPGFQDVFGVAISRAEDPAAHIIWPEDPGSLDGATPSERVTRALGQALAQLSAVRGSFDVVAVHLPDRWPGLRAPDFDAHDQLKALAAVAGIPTQVLNDRVFTFSHRASRSWRLGVAWYVKAGGIPWKLASLPAVPDNTAYIGLAYAMRDDPGEARFVTCCSQVFDADGGGMQFVAYDARDPIEDVEVARRNPYLSKSDMRAVLARSLRVYQARNGGDAPRRVVIHKTTGFTDDEISGASEALATAEEIDCIEVTTNVAWRAVWLGPGRASGSRSEPDAYPVHRGTMQPLSGSSALLWVAGNAPDAGLRGNYYQGKKSIPKPIRLTRHAGGGPLELAATEALALTKMDWNNDALYDPVPVTVRYSQRLARTIAHVPNLPRNEYPYRLFM
jgi:hypothetical protein